MTDVHAPPTVQTVFNRYEKKYLMPEPVYLALRERLAPYMQVDCYGVTRICNIYYDTADSMLIRRSIESPVYKEKLRLRTYGVPTLNSTAFLEIKKKYKGLVNKRRVTMPLYEAIAYVENGLPPSGDYSAAEQQILREIDFFLKRYPLRPALNLSYERIAMFETANPDFRVTFDRDIRGRRENMHLDYGAYGTALLPEGYYLMETKILDASPLWFTRILSELSIYQTRFSKYGNLYLQEYGAFDAEAFLCHRLENWAREGELHHV